MRQTDAGLPAGSLLVRLLGVPRAVRHDGENSPATPLDRRDKLPFALRAVNLQTVFVFFVVKYEPVTYGNRYAYPWWGEWLGITMSLMSMVWIPLYAAYYLITEPGTLKQVTRTTFAYMVSLYA